MMPSCHHKTRGRPKSKATRRLMGRGGCHSNPIVCTTCPQAWYWYSFYQPQMDGAYKLGIWTRGAEMQSALKGETYFFVNVVVVFNFKKLFQSFQIVEIMEDFQKWHLLRKKTLWKERETKQEQQEQQQQQQQQQQRQQNINLMPNGNRSFDSHRPIRSWPTSIFIFLFHKANSLLSLFLSKVICHGLVFA